MSLPFLPRSLVTTTLGSEREHAKDGDEAFTVKERKKTRLWSCRGDDDHDGSGGGDREREERET